MQKKRGRRIVGWVFGGIGALLVLGVAGILIWSQVGVMQAEPGPLADARANQAITIEDAPEGIVLAPADGDSDRGLVFIPGAKVDPWAYAAALQGVAAEGTTVVITRPWLNLAFFDPRGLDAFTPAAPTIDDWSVGGHSLGGVRACQLASDATALVLFGSYCATDLSADELRVLSLSGSEDGLSTPQKVSDARPLLPPDAEMVEIEGAAHASFGDYGTQAGDGTPTLTDAQMHVEVTDALGPFLSEATPVE